MSNKNQSKKINTTQALADYLGMSRWTVSRALNKQPGVKEETRKRIEEAIDELGFSPNLMAIGLKGGKTHLIGICFQELESPLLSVKTGILQRLLQKRGYRTIFEVANGDPSAEIEIIKHFNAVSVEGIILIGSKLKKDSRSSNLLNSIKVPVVAVDTEMEMDSPVVLLDRAKALNLIIDHLWELGHRRFGFVDFSENVFFGQHRIQVIKEVLTRLGANIESDLKWYSAGEKDSEDCESGYRLGQELIEQNNPPSALIALNDRVAYGVMRAIMDSDYSIPNDFSLVGFDNLEVSRYVNPPLTSIDQQIEVMMETAINTLFAVMKGDAVQKISYTQPILKIRESTSRF